MDLHPNIVRISHKSPSAFTLVELLVVIGIIALLISILLPALNKARREALTLKCASNMREIGHAYMMYATDNGGWFPPAKITPESPYTYSLPKLNYTANSGQPYWWYNFISRYISTYNFGTYGETGSSGSGNVMQSVIWGCPSWTGYTGVAGGGNGVTSTSGGVAASQPGYGINLYPLFTPNSPVASASNMWPASSTDVEGWKTGSMGDTANGGSGQFFPATVYNHSSERALMTDSIFWITLSMYIQKGDTPISVPAFLTNNATTPSQAEGQTWADFYRHGVYPKVVSSGGGGGKGGGTSSVVGYAPTGGKVAYNILFCDGHVITSNSPTDAFLYFRMKYPG